MLTLIRLLSRKQLLLEQVPIFILSLLLAEFNYKFHSFILECTAFLATWMFLDFVVQLFIKRFADRK